MSASLTTADEALAFEVARLLIVNRDLRDRITRLENAGREAIAMLEEYIPNPAKHPAHEEDLERVERIRKTVTP